MMTMKPVPISQKYNLTVNEASAYFNIGVKKIRKLILENPSRFTVSCGNKKLIVRHKFEKFIDESTAV